MSGREREMFAQLSWRDMKRAHGFRACSIETNGRDDILAIDLPPLG